MCVCVDDSRPAVGKWIRPSIRRGFACKLRHTCAAFPSFIICLISEVPKQTSAAQSQYSETWDPEHRKRNS